MGLDAAAVNVIMVMVRLAMTGRAAAAAALQPIQAHIMHTIRCWPSICTAIHHHSLCRLQSTAMMQGMLWLVLQFLIGKMLLGMHDTADAIRLNLTLC